jgi:MULE transposase domain
MLQYYLFTLFCIFERENEENYTWASEMFKKVLGGEVQLSVVVTDRELALMNAIKIIFRSTLNILCL